jgi:hypothetical protein
MRRGTVLFAMLLASAPPAATAQSARVIELGVTTGTAHHDFRNRYPGEGNFERTLGVRADLRLLPTPIGVVGITLVFDRYGYNETGFYCTRGCTNDALNTANGFTANAPWRVDRRGAGLSIQRALPLRLGVNLGVLAGATERTYVGGSPPPPFVPFEPSPAHEWFRGIDGGLSVRWRDLVVGVQAEYGRMPHALDAPNPYYANISARVAYALPLPHVTGKLFH